MYDYYKYDQNKFLSTGAVLDPSEGPPLLMTGPAITPSPVQLLPPVPTTCAPAPVPILVPGMVVAPPSVITSPQSVSKSCTVGYNSLEEAMKAMNLQSSEELVDAIKGSLQEGLDKVKASFTVRHTLLLTSPYSLIINRWSRCDWKYLSNYQQQI